MRRAAGNRLARHPIEYFGKFYADSAVSGSTSALMCGHSFFGADRLLFGTDVPYDAQSGDYSVRQTIDSIERMDISPAEKAKIFEGNARALLRL